MSDGTKTPGANRKGTIGVVGAGLMGAGIAQVAAVAGYDVVLQDIGREQVARGITAVETSLAKLVSKNRLEHDVAQAAIARINTTTSLSELAAVELIVEAVFEQLSVKQDLFAKLDAVANADTILATNTSALPITQIAAATHRPRQVVGTHFFSPVPLMQLCELVRGDATSDETLAAARTFAENMGKTCIVVNRDVAGFVTTRLIAALAIEAVRLVELGVATSADVDTACRLGFGHPMGPLETLDLTGIDVMVHAADHIAAETPGETFAVPALLRRMVTDGELGRKSGRGFYDYSG